LRVLPNPAPTTGIQDLDFANGHLYALTGYDKGSLQAWELNPSNGAVITGPVAIGFPGTQDANGFTILPDGNFLINDEDLSCTYQEYDSLTGQAMVFSIDLPLDRYPCSGVDTDGTFLY